jgi:formylglycine-generating enzyme required for sulfatase activity
MLKDKDTRNFPVDDVSWEDAAAFCRKLSELPEEMHRGRVYRLPTEAEWEYACRGGATSSTPFSFGNSLSSTQANFNGNHPHGGAATGPFLERTSAVGSYPANSFGLYDMHGNVWEWCQDRYAEDYYAKSPKKDPQGPAPGTHHLSLSYRFQRGGCWNDAGKLCRSASRKALPATSRFHFVGFRVALTVASSPAGPMAQSTAARQAGDQKR